MNTTKRFQNVAAITAGMMAAATLPTVEIKNFALAGDGLARVTVDVTHNQHSRTNHDLVRQAIETKLEGKMAAVAGSFRLLDSGNFADRISGVVSVTRKAIPATEENMKGFRATASNMFMDDEKDMWVLRKTEAGALLVKTTGIDDDMTLVNLLESHSSAGFRNSADWGRVTASAHNMCASVQGGDFVSYVNINNQVVHGFVVASVADTDNLVVLPTGAAEVDTIGRAAVTEVHSQDGFPNPEKSKEDQLNEVTAAARGEIDLDFLAEFYKKVYARSPQFYAAFMQRVNEHAFF